jgi:hypothetical protein
MSGWNPPPGGGREDESAGRPGGGVPAAFGSQGQGPEPRGDAGEDERAGGGGGRGPFGRSYTPRHRSARRRRKSEPYDRSTDGPTAGAPDGFDAFTREPADTREAAGPAGYADGPWSPGPAGYAGTPGTPGPAYPGGPGAPGPAGNADAPWSHEPAGYAGTPGPADYPGAPAGPGPASYPGGPGAPGPAGNTGAPWSHEPAGYAGTPGPADYPGAPGPANYPGGPGPANYAGVPGPAGNAGAQGPRRRRIASYNSYWDPRKPEEDLEDDAAAEPPPDAPDPRLYTPDSGAPDPYAPMPVVPDPYGGIHEKVGPDGGRRPAPPPPSPKEPSGFWTGLAIAVTTLVVLSTVGVVVLNRYDFINFGTSRRIVRANVAGGYKLDPNGVAIYSRVFDPYRQLLQRVTGNRISPADVVTGVYNAGKDPGSGLRRQVLFLGGVGELGNPREVASGIADREEKRVGIYEVTVRDTDPGPRGGRAACIERRIAKDKLKRAVPQGPETACFWLTENTLGYIVLTTSATTDDVAPIMRKMRLDLEVEEG